MGERLRPPFGALALGLLLSAAPAPAQQSEPIQPPAPDQEAPDQEPAGQRRSKPPSALLAAGAETPDEIRIKADTFGGTPGHAWYRGVVDLTAGETRIQCDQMDLYETENADGSKGRKAVAEGNVVFIRGDERISGTRLTLDLVSGVGVFEDAMGFVQPGVFVEGRTIERLDADTYRVEGAKFTSCSQPNPRWAFDASSARIEVDDKVVAKNVVFRVKQVPALYIPYFVYPIREDQRSTGFLFPSFGYSSVRGVNLGGAFFWAMGRSLDQTFALDNYSKFGYGFGHELRYTAASPSRGTFRTYVFQPRTDGAELDYDLDYQAQQQLPGKVRATLSVRQYSNLSFQQSIQDSLNLATSRTRRASFNLQRSVGKTNVQLLADSTDTFFSNRTRINRHLPLLRLSMAPQKLAGSALAFRYDARVERLENGTKNDANPNVNRVFEYNRYDANPELSLPMSLSFLQVTPQIEGRYTYYSDSLDENGDPTGSVLRRSYFESSVEMRGPTFARVYNTPGNFYSEKYKHVIGPEFVYRYRSGVEDFSNILRFDAVDIVRNTNQIQYSIVQSLLAKRPVSGVKALPLRGAQGRAGAGANAAPARGVSKGDAPAGGKEQPYEFLTWRVGQTYYEDPASREFDHAYSSNGFASEGASHLSPLQSQLDFQPSPRFRTNFDLEYDLNDGVLRSLSLGANLVGERASLQASWSRSESFLRNERTIPARSSVRGTGRLDLLPRRLRLEVQGNYDFVLRRMLQSSSRLRYDVQCCGFLAEVIRYDFNERIEQQFRFSIELANIGSFGNFNGDERGQQQARGFGNFR
jgi:LPS-assembly protein